MCLLRAADSSSESLLQMQLKDWNSNTHFHIKMINRTQRRSGARATLETDRCGEIHNLYILCKLFNKSICSLRAARSSRRIRGKNTTWECVCIYILSVLLFCLQRKYNWNYIYSRVEQIPEHSHNFPKRSTEPGADAEWCALLHSSRSTFLRLMRFSRSQSLPRRRRFHIWYDYAECEKTCKTFL